ncbi:glutathione S-transferase N-terminal domain-containing protein [Paracoccus kondratievae]
MPTLFYHAGACSLAPHIVLEWTGTPYEAVAVEFGSPELLAVNPAGAVPVLREDDGWTLTQAGAILHHLVRKHPQADLGGGDDLHASAEFDRWSSFFTGDLHPAFFPVFTPGAIPPAANRPTTTRYKRPGASWCASGWRSLMRILRGGNGFWTAARRSTPMLSRCCVGP